MSLDYGNVCAAVATPLGWGLGPVFAQNCPGENTDVTDKMSYTFALTPRVADGSCGGTQVVQKMLVARTREFYCPRGYIRQGNHCEANGLDIGKNLGPCRQCALQQGDPINIGIGNKYEIETDYVGGGDSPLAFRRYYNSSMRIGNRDNGYYATAYWFDSFGSHGFATIATEPSSLDSRIAAVGIDQMGANWRHTYQRAIRFESPTTDLSTAYAYRHDGRVYAFIQASTGFVGPADVSDKLSRASDGTWTYVTSDDEIESYDAVGKLLSIQDRGGRLQTLLYDGCNRLSTVSDAFGHQLTFEYVNACSNDGEVRQLHRVIDSAGGAYVFQYDAVTNVLQSVTYPDSTVRSYRYENASFPRAMTGKVDESGVQYATFSYDGFGRASSSQLIGGIDSVGITYASGSPDFAGSNATVVDALGTSRAYTMTSKLGVPKLASLNQPCPQCVDSVKAQAYDANGNVASRTDFNSITTTYAYDLTRNLEISRTEASGTPHARTIKTQWHAAFRVPTLVTEPNRTTAYTYDSQGNRVSTTVTDTSVTPNVSRTWTYTYNTSGQLLTMDGPRTDVSDVTTYTYYACMSGYQCGQLHTVTDALGHVTTYNTYDAHGQPLTITDANGVVTALAYDSRQRLRSRTVGTEQTAFDYWPTGLLKKATLPDGSFVSYLYDGAHRLVEMDDSAGNRLVYTLDAMGNRIAENLYDESNSLSGTHTRVFDTLSRVASEINAAGTAAVTTKFGYDSNGNRTTVDAPLARHTSSVYDELNRLTQTTDAANAVTQLGYDASGRLISVTDPRSLQTTYAYSGFGDLAQERSPDRGAIANTFDEAGNLKSFTDARSKSATYAYDALNRAVQLQYPDQTQTFAYDQGANGVGRLTGVNDASGSMSWTYTALGRVASRTQTVGSVTKSIAYGYNPIGQLTSVTLPSTHVITIGYTNNRIASLRVDGTDVLTGALYEPFGPARAWTWGNGTLAVRSYDLDGQVAAVDSAGLSTYTFNDDGTIRSRHDDVPSPFTEVTGASALTVDAASNRLNATGGAFTRTYTYDAAGNVTSDGSRMFTYNDAGRMTSATAGASTTTYLVNALGQRIRKSNKSATTYFVYDDAGHLLGEYTASGALVEELVWLGDIPVATLRPSGSGIDIFYIHTDHLDTPRKITRPSDNAIVWRWDSDPFGTTPANENPTGLGAFEFNLRYPGQYFDQETGLSYNYFRDYDPQTGRYMESDPIGLGGGINTFSYADQLPTMRTDSFGLATYMCTKPLHALGDKWGHRMYPVSGWNPSPLYHQFFCVKDSDGKVTCGGQDRTGNAFVPGSPGKPSNDSWPSSGIGSCEKRDDRECVDQCVIKAVSSTKRPWYAIGPLGTDCQEWSDDVLKQCRKKCRGKK